MRAFQFILILLLYSSFIVKGQGNEKSDTLCKMHTKQIEFKLGFGKLQPQLMAFDFNYILPVFKSISAIYFSQIDFSAGIEILKRLHLLQTNFICFN